MKRSQLNAISRYYTRQRQELARGQIERAGKTMEDFNESGYKSITAYANAVLNDNIKIKQWTVTISSNSTLTKTYKVNYKSALKAGEKLGRAEGGEVIMVYEGDKVIDLAEWSAEEKKYIRLGVK